MATHSADDDDRPDGHASRAAQEADAVDAVERGTKTQTTAASYSTRDHDVVRAWAEARGGRPAGAGGSGDDPGVLRIEFPERGDDDGLDEVDWSDFFAKFDDSGLAFVYQENTSDGATSRFHRFVRDDDGR